MKAFGEGAARWVFPSSHLTRGRYCRDAVRGIAREVAVCG
jgi:hypothetical protein